MTPERWGQIKELFQAALERAPQQRAAFLSQACASDDALRQEVELLLAADAESHLIDRPAVSAAAELFATRTLPTPLDAATALPVGQAIGPYQILRLIGRGGMGEVYLARDTRLERRVALKLLPAHLTGDAERVRRFEREARSVSALNHPNIVTVYDFGEEDGRHYIAAEFVAGQTLRAVLDDSDFKLTQALDVTIQVAGALSAAHEAGIIHRDIKPENIMLRPDGYVKVLDFGLAKLTEARPSVDDAATIGSGGSGFKTRTGMVLGTVSYMSPEQAAGQKVDARTDLFSLGVVLYEMVSGHRPFEGRTHNHVLVAILDAEPPALSSYAAAAPVELESIINKALRKDREQRYQTAQELLDDLRKLKQDVELQARIETSSPEELLASARTRASGGQASAASAVATSNAVHLTDKTKLPKKAALIIAAALAVALAAVAFWIYRPPAQNKLAASFQTTQPVRINTVRRALAATISPDGKYVAYVTSDAAGQSIWLKQLATNTDTTLAPPAELIYRWLGFSPDGNYLYYSANKGSEPRALYRMAATGGPARKLPGRSFGAFSFSPDGKRLAVVEVERDGETALKVVDVDGSGERKLASRREPERFGIYGLDWSPDGKVIVCGEFRVTDREVMTPVAVSVADGTVRPITSRQWSMIGRVVWLRDGSGLIMVASEDAAPRDTGQLWFLSYPGGEARRITNDLSGYSWPDLSLTADSGALLSLKSDVLCNLWVAPADAPSRAKQITFGPVGRRDGLRGLSWTPDGKLVYSSYLFKGLALFTMNADGTDTRQLTGGDYMDDDLTTTPDGRYLLVDSNRAGRFNIWRLDIDGNNPKQLTYGPVDFNPYCSPDGKWVFYMSTFEGKRMLCKMPIDGGEPIRFFDKDVRFLAFSPDGKLVAAVYWDEQVKTRQAGVISTETGQLLKVLDFPGYYWSYVGWTPDGRAVAYVKTQGDVSNLWAQPLDGGKAVQLTDFKSDLIFNFAWSNDGKQLALARGSETSDVLLIKDLK